MDYFDQIQRFESLTRRLVEGSFEKILGGKAAANDVARSVAQSMDKNRRDRFAPSHFDIHLQPEIYTKLNQELAKPEEQILIFVEKLANETGLIFTDQPVVFFIKANHEQRLPVIVNASFADSQGESTRAFKTIKKQNTIEEINQKDAFLIVNGKRHFRLNKPMISIGRQLDNDVVLDDAVVSRKHAQIRWRFGRFVIHDVGSRSGTSVNGNKITEAVLDSGDVVKIGNCSLIYGEDAPETNDGHPNENHRDGITQELRRSDL